MAERSDDITEYGAADNVLARRDGWKIVLDELEKWGKEEFVGFSCFPLDGYPRVSVSVTGNGGAWAVCPINACMNLLQAKNAIIGSLRDFVNGWYGDGWTSYAPSPNALESMVMGDGSNGVYVVECGVHMDGCYVDVSSVHFCEGVGFKFKGPMTEERGLAIKDFFSRDLSSGKVTEECQ